MNRALCTSIIFLSAIGAHALGAGPVRITAKESEPMKEICDQIADLFHWRITFEEAPLLNPSEQFLEKSPSGILWHRMHAVPVAFDVPAMLADEPLFEYQHRVMDAVIYAYAHSRNRGVYRYSQEGDFIHVVPSAVGEADGRLSSVASILDVRVSVKLGTYNLGEIVDSVLEQVSMQAGKNVAPGTCRPSMLITNSLRLDSNDEPASELLCRVFEEINGGRYKTGARPLRLKWTLMYTEDGPPYFFNLNNAPPAFDLPSIAERSRTGVPPAAPSSPDHGQPKAGFITPK